MKRIGIFILSLLLTAISCAPRADIPVKRMIEIYYEIALLDQYVDNYPEMRTQSDSMRVYAPLLDKYGYTEEEFINSIHFYLRDPESFLRIIESVNQKLGEREQYLAGLQQTEDFEEIRMMEEDEDFREGAPVEEHIVSPEEDAFGLDTSVRKRSFQETSVQDTVAQELPDTKKRRTKTREKRLSKEDLLEISKKFKEQEKK